MAWFQLDWDQGKVFTNLLIILPLIGFVISAVLYATVRLILHLKYKKKRKPRRRRRKKATVDVLLTNRALQPLQSHLPSLNVEQMKMIANALFERQRRHEVDLEMAHDKLKEELASRKIQPHKLAMIRNLLRYHMIDLVAAIREVNASRGLYWYNIASLQRKTSDMSEEDYNRWLIDHSFQMVLQVALEKSSFSKSKVVERIGKHDIDYNHYIRNVMISIRQKPSDENLLEGQDMSGTSLNSEEQRKWVQMTQQSQQPIVRRPSDQRKSATQSDPHSNDYAYAKIYTIGEAPSTDYEDPISFTKLLASLVNAKTSSEDVDHRYF